jgi:hypothetical protein
MSQEYTVGGAMINEFASKGLAELPRRLSYGDCDGTGAGPEMRRGNIAGPEMRRDNISARVLASCLYEPSRILPLSALFSFKSLLFLSHSYLALSYFALSGLAYSLLALSF